MKTTINRIAAALALAFAIGLAQTARADYWDWVGKGSGQTSYFDEHGNGKGTTGCWYHSVATSTDNFANDNHNFESAGSGGRPSFNSGWDKVVTFRKSSAMNGNEAYLTDSLFNKICAAFQGLFNLDYLLTGDGRLLLDEPQFVSEEHPSSFIPSWADAFLDILANQVKENEALNRELRQSIERANVLCANLETLISKL